MLTPCAEQRTGRQAGRKGRDTTFFAAKVLLVWYGSTAYGERRISPWGSHEAARHMAIRQASGEAWTQDNWVAGSGAADYAAAPDTILDTPPEAASIPSE
ncbi:hypothetical protein NDU88_007677 [Pleurodeles waltl]|uniref:Uncharacterized protein n=1 Tax=Pleurodeles waltl TaxID=8319 RepID=A0AAV7NXA1_PLEWA|nr:hypothetical protein NDU88_007677 [Pleurodeles waltl]